MHTRANVVKQSVSLSGLVSQSVYCKNWYTHTNVSMYIPNKARSESMFLWT